MGDSNISNRFGRKLAGIAASFILILASLHVTGVSAQISDLPLRTATGADPNILFIIDDSGSMAWSFMPDGVYWRCGNDSSVQQRARGRSSDYNDMYYNPERTYEPPFGSDGSRLPDASFTSAWTDGYQQEGSVNLETNFRATWYYDWSNTRSHCGGAGAADYYVYDEECGDDENNACYNRTIVGDDEQQNFANWYSYYRTRMLASRAGISGAFNELDNERVGYGSINHSGTIVRGVRPFHNKGESWRSDFYDWLHDVQPTGGTPLRRALNAAGEYYEDSSDTGPWSTDPSNADGEQIGEFAECRASATVLMTDGFYNASFDGLGNVDGASGPMINGVEGQSYQYQPVDPFEDEWSNTLGDIAMHYWNRDLQPAMTNDVPASTGNPAFWQHMMTYGVGLGVSGNIDPDDAFAAIENNDDIAWPDPQDGNLEKMDDLLHAAVNSRGGFFAADDPITFGNELQELIKGLGSGSGSATSAAASSAILSDGADRYTASFDGSDWSGDLVSTNIKTDTIEWTANDKLSEQTNEGSNPENRNLFTFDGTSAVALDSFTALSSQQQDALNRGLDSETDNLGEDRLRWLRGEVEVRVNEDEDEFRSRVFGKDSQSEPDQLRLVGDIVGSNPQIDRKINFGFDRLPDGDYRGFRQETEYIDRPQAIYVGSNNGYLHAFDSDTGEELFAYMPGSLLQPEGGDNEFAPVNRLMEPDYEHRFYVDGTPTLSDAYLNDEWKTVMVGSMGVGGDRVFALDVTTPESFGTDDVLWEFEHSDLGRGVDRVQVGRLPSGKWAAIFGNGYDQNTGELFVVDLEDGSLIAKLDGGSDGLSTPVLTVQDGMVNLAYAGNLNGELWRFDLSDDKNNPKYDSAELFQAVDPDGNPQPITAKPRVAVHPDRADTNIVTFGTGSFIRATDRNDSQVQSLYGVFDKNGESSDITRDDMQMQEITAQEGRTVEVLQDDGTTEDTDYTIRKVSENLLDPTDKGWYLDLQYGTANGERVINQATFPTGLIRNRVRFTSLSPDEDPCGPSVSGWVMDLSLATGGRASVPVFDLERDGEFTDREISMTQDLSEGEELSTILDVENNTEQVLDPPGGSGPGLRGGGPGVGRQSWEQLR